MTVNTVDDWSRTSSERETAVMAVGTLALGAVLFALFFGLVRASEWL